jgi:hypothetical protein
MPWGYHAVKNIGLGKFFVEMGWIDVSRNDGEQLDILVRQRAHETGRVANFQFVEGSICNRVHDISFALSQNVIAAIDIFDIAGESLCSVANEECGKAADILDRYELMLRRAQAATLQKLVEAIDT